MRKIAAIFVILALIMAVAVACGNGGDDTTSQTIGTQYTPVEQPTSQVSVSQTGSAMSYVLTTQAERTVPWVSTTRFEITEAPSTSDAFLTTVPSTDYNISFNVSEVIRPDVNISNATTVPKTTSDAPNNNGNESTTAASNSEPVQLIVNSTAYGGGIIYVEVDPSNWSSGFVSATQNITVKVNGDSLAVSCKVPSKKTGDCYEIKIDLSSQDIPEGSTVEFTIPTGIVKNKGGTQHNLSYSSSIVAE